MHASVSGNVHFLAEDDADAIRIVAASCSPSCRRTTPRTRRIGSAPTSSCDEDEGMNDLVPVRSVRADGHARASSRRLVDNGDFLEVHALFAENLIVGFAPHRGRGGRHHRQQLDWRRPGALDIDSSDKGARFIRFCNDFNIPLVTLVDVPGFLPGIEQERGGIIRHGAKMLFAYAPARRCRRSRSSPARPMAAPISRCAARRWAPTSSSPGRPPKSR